MFRRGFEQIFQGYESSRRAASRYIAGCFLCKLINSSIVNVHTEVKAFIVGSTDNYKFQILTIGLSFSLLFKSNGSADD